MEAGGSDRALSEIEVREVLRRAVRLDAQRGGMTVSELRLVAEEAGIDSDAVTLALRQVIGPEPEQPLTVRTAIAADYGRGAGAADAFGLWACFMAGWSIVFGQVTPDLVFSVGSIGILAAFVGIAVLRAGGPSTPDPTPFGDSIP